MAAASRKVLVVEDEDSIRELIEYNLRKEGFAVTAVASGEEGLRRARSEPPDLVLLDLLLPGMDGMEVCRALKRDPKTAAVPVVMLTAKGEEIDVVTGLELGADDYLTKPFSPRILVARIRAVLRRGRERHATEKAEVVSAGDLLINRGRREVTIAGRAVDLTWTEFELLALLASRPGWVFSRTQIMDGVRGSDYFVTERAVDVQVVGLRRKLGAAGKLIETVRGVGYRFKD